jgi:hypothetical protein
MLLAQVLQRLHGTRPRTLIGEFALHHRVCAVEIHDYAPLFCSQKAPALLLGSLLESPCPATVVTLPKSEIH